MQKEGNHVTNISRTCNNNGTLVDLARPKYPNYVSFTTEINIYQQERTYLPGQPGMRRTNTIQLNKQLINCSLHFLVTVVYINIGREKQVLACSCLSGEVIYFYVPVFSRQMWTWFNPGEENPFLRHEFQCCLLCQFMIYRISISIYKTSCLLVILSLGSAIFCASCFHVNRFHLRWFVHVCSTQMIIVYYIYRQTLLPNTSFRPNQL